MVVLVHVFSPDLFWRQSVPFGIISLGRLNFTLKFIAFHHRIAKPTHKSLLTVRLLRVKPTRELTHIPPAAVWWVDEVTYVGTGGDVGV